MGRRKRRKGGVKDPQVPPPPKPAGRAKPLADFSRVKSSVFAKRLQSKFDSKFKDMKKLWRPGLGRVAGNGMSGTASRQGRQVIAFIFKRCLLACREHTAFTDVGCDVGEMMAFAWAAGFNSVYGIEVHGLDSNRILFDFTTGALDNATTPVEAAFGVNAADPKTTLYPSGTSGTWPHLGSKEARCIYSFDVG